MAGKGGLSHKFYRETRGLKIAAGEKVKTGSILTRQGDKWKSGLNVSGRTTLFALKDGIIYFTKTKGKRNKEITAINIKA
ncbi:MAG: 50S ribosomal protein L27 [Candidatus Omnitrophota bacterium]|nr:50S ribosomal protein L27 [Candidatus Omnitrophota bacterium]